MGLDTASQEHLLKSLPDVSNLWWGQYAATKKYSFIQQLFTETPLYRLQNPPVGGGCLGILRSQLYGLYKCPRSTLKGLNAPLQLLKSSLRRWHLNWVTKEATHGPEEDWQFCQKETLGWMMQFGWSITVTEQEGAGGEDKNAKVRRDLYLLGWWFGFPHRHQWQKQGRFLSLSHRSLFRGLGEQGFCSGSQVSFQLLL